MPRAWLSSRQRQRRRYHTRSGSCVPPPPPLTRGFAQESAPPALLCPLPPPRNGPNEVGALGNAIRYQELNAWAHRAKLQHLKPPTFHLPIPEGDARVARPRAADGRWKVRRADLIRVISFRRQKLCRSRTA